MWVPARSPECTECGEPWMAAVTLSPLLGRWPGVAVSRRAPEPRGDDALWLLAGPGRPSRPPAEGRAAAGEAAGVQVRVGAGKPVFVVGRSPWKLRVAWGGWGVGDSGVCGRGPGRLVWEDGCRHGSGVPVRSRGPLFQHRDRPFPRSAGEGTGLLQGRAPMSHPGVLWAARLTPGGVSQSLMGTASGLWGAGLVQNEVTGPAPPAGVLPAWTLARRIVWAPRSPWPVVR